MNSLQLPSLLLYDAHHHLQIPPWLFTLLIYYEIRVLLGDDACFMTVRTASLMTQADFVSMSLLQVLLLFPRADAQCSALERAADVGRYDVDVVRSTDVALQSFVARQHDVVVVDTRPGSSDIDAESFARSARSTHSGYLPVA